MYASVFTVVGLAILVIFLLPVWPGLEDVVFAVKDACVAAGKRALAAAKELGKRADEKIKARKLFRREKGAEDEGGNGAKAEGTASRPIKVAAASAGASNKGEEEERDVIGDIRKYLKVPCAPLPLPKQRRTRSSRFLLFNDDDPSHNPVARAGCEW